MRKRADVGHMKQVLDARGRLLGRQLKSQAAAPLADIAPDHGGDEADEALAVTFADLRVLEAGRNAAELNAISDALERLEDGSYGYCTDCGDEIAAERLAAHPTAIRCFQCQHKYERMHWSPAKPRG